MAWREKPTPDVFTSEIKVVPVRTANPPLILKTSPKTVAKVPKPPEVTKKPMRMLFRAPGTSSTIPLQTTLSQTRTRDNGFGITLIS